MENKKALTAPCGLDCFNCPVHERNLTEDLAEVIHTQRGVPKEEIACRGCRQQDGKHYHLPRGCATFDCAKAKDVAFCCDCAEFPCAFLAPTADMAGHYVHNIKVYNLCRIKNIGLERWIAEEAGPTRESYFSCKFAMGRGQAGPSGIAPSRRAGGEG